MSVTVSDPRTSVDARAVDQLDTDAQRAGFYGLYRIVRPTDGPTTIRFTSRQAFHDAVDYGLIRIGNPHLTTVGALETHVPVTFGHPYAWNAWATYPVQDFGGCSYCGSTSTTHGDWCKPVAADEPIPYLPVELPVRTPNAATNIHYAPRDLGGAVSCGVSAGGFVVFATTDPLRVTCLDCMGVLSVPDADGGPADAMAGICMYCPSVAALTAEGRIAEHADADDSATICAGSGEWPATDWSDEQIPKGTRAELEAFLAARWPECPDCDALSGSHEPECDEADNGPVTQQLPSACVPVGVELIHGAEHPVSAPADAFQIEHGPDAGAGNDAEIARTTRSAS